MQKKVAKPKWLLLFILVPIMTVLLFLAHRYLHSQWGKEAADLIILGVIFGLIFLWMRLNSSALFRAEEGSYTEWHLMTAESDEQKEYARVTRLSNPDQVFDKERWN